MESVGWFQLDRGASSIAVKCDKLYGGVPDIDFIVAVTPGGWVPALILSELWEKPVVAAGYRDDDNVMTILPTVFGDRASGTGAAAPVPRLFVVSNETSRAMDRVVQHYRNQEHLCITAALFHREGGPGLRPKVFWRILGDDETIKYPWEN